MGVAVDLAIFTVQEGRLELLLIRMKREPYNGKWAMPGGRIRGDETVEQAAARELHEKAGMRDVYLEQLYTFSEPDRAIRARAASRSRTWRSSAATCQLRTTDKYSGIGWFPVDAAAAAGVRPQARSPATRSSGCAPSWSGPTWRATCSTRPSRSASCSGCTRRSSASGSIARNFQRRACSDRPGQGHRASMRTGQAYRPARLSGSLDGTYCQTYNK